MPREFVLGFVIYKPKLSFLDTLEKIIELGFPIYIFDNSPEIAQVRNFTQNKIYSEIKYFTCGKNAGLGVGISTICAQAYYDSHKSLLFFDQDTFYNDVTLKYIEEFYLRNSGIEKEYTSIMFNSKNITDNNIYNYEFRTINISINSGSLFFLENLSKIGWHDISYFVDCVDYEYCLRSDNKKFKIGECSSTPGFDHKSGQDDIECMVLGKMRSLRRYSYSRIKDTFFASNRIIIASIRTHNFKFLWIMLKSLIGYLIWQVVARFVKISKYQDKNSQ